MTHDDLINALTDTQIELGQGHARKAMDRLDVLKADLIKNGLPALPEHDLVPVPVPVRLLFAQVNAPEGAMVTINFPEPKHPQAQAHEEDDDE